MHVIARMIVIFIVAVMLVVVVVVVIDVVVVVVVLVVVVVVVCVPFRVHHHPNPFGDSRPNGNMPPCHSAKPAACSRRSPKQPWVREAPLVQGNP